MVSMARPLAHKVIYPDQHGLGLSQRYFDLINIFRSLKLFREVSGLLEGLFSDGELKKIILRWQIAKWLWTTDLTYREIARILHISFQTVGSVADKILSEQHRDFMFVLMYHFGSTHRKAWKSYGK
jgi:Trp operon repressor